MDYFITYQEYTLKYLICVVFYKLKRIHTTCHLLKNYNPFLPLFVCTASWIIQIQARNYPNVLVTGGLHGE